MSRYGQTEGSGYVSVQPAEERRGGKNVDWDQVRPGEAFPASEDPQEAAPEPAGE